MEGLLNFLSQGRFCPGEESHGRDVFSPEVSAGLFFLIGLFAREEGFDSYRDGSSDLRDPGRSRNPDIIESSVSSGPVEEGGVVGEKGDNVARGFSLEGLFMKVGSTIDPGFRG